MDRSPRPKGAGAVTLSHVRVSSLKLVRVDDEARMVRNFVVECPAGGVGCLGLPIHATTSGLARCGIYSLDEFLRDAKTPVAWAREQVLQIADLV